MNHTPEEIKAHLRAKVADHKMQSALAYIEKLEAGIREGREKVRQALAALDERQP